MDCSALLEAWRAGLGTLLKSVFSLLYQFSACVGNISDHVQLLFDSLVDVVDLALDGKYGYNRGNHQDKHDGHIDYGHPIKDVL
jgi:hypothetical protein